MTMSEERSPPLLTCLLSSFPLYLPPALPPLCRAQAAAGTQERGQGDN